VGISEFSLALREMLKIVLKNRKVRDASFGVFLNTIYSIKQKHPGFRVF
jgi:hypothetical protein